MILLGLFVLAVFVFGCLGLWFDFERAVHDALEDDDDLAVSA